MEFASLKELGYRIIATTPSRNGISLEEFDLAKGKTAICFGTELNGLSDDILQEANEFLTIPMYGFTESFNISVAAAIILFTLTQQLRNSTIDWKLTENDSLEVKLNWLRRSVRNAKKIEQKYYSDKKV